MANEDLKAEVSRLQSDLNGIEAENRRLEGEIATVVGAIDNANRGLNDASASIRAHLSGADSTLGAAHQQVIRAYEVQQSMDELYRRLKQMELANKRIRECNNKKFYDFAVYRTVRKIVQGVMDNLDFSMVSEDIIAKAVERKQLENPDYWLTSVLVAVVAWRADQKERAQRALARAMRLDDRKTASFLMVLYLRLRRESVALQWFRYLIAGQLKGSEKAMVLLFFSMMSNTIEDRIADGTRQTVATYVNGLVDEGLARSGESHGAAVNRIVGAYAALADDNAFPYDVIRACVPDYANLQRGLTLARNNANIIDFIAETMNVEDSARNEFLKRYVDQIVAAPCQAEQEVYDEITCNEFIIRFQGDVDAAQQSYAELRKHDQDDFDIIAEMLDWIFARTGREEANAQMRRNMFVATRRLQQEAGDEYVRRYRSLVTPMQHIVIDDFAVDGDLRNVQGNSDVARKFYGGKAQADKALVKDVWAIVLLVAGVVGGILLGVLVQPALAGVGVLAVIGGGVWLLLNHFARKRIDLKYEQAVRAVQERLQMLFADWQHYEKDFHVQDLLSQTLNDRLAAL